MRIGVVKENFPGEKRLALLPVSAGCLAKKGFSVRVEAGAGAGIHISDDDFVKAGAGIAGREEILTASDIQPRVRRPRPEELPQMKRGCLMISFLDPFNDSDLIRSLADHEINAVSLQMIPRTTISQKMDALSSQASLAGYAAVVMAAAGCDRIFPMMMTPAGTIPPLRVFVIGAGVAGLQAIATAKRLGALVEAFDTRPGVEDQIKSLGAKFLRIDLGETGQTKDGYAKALTLEQLEKQHVGMSKACAGADIVLTTAQIFGKKAPRIITREMIGQMRPGSIIVDMAVETGGNVEGSELDKEIVVKGIKIIGLGNLPSRVAVTASQMFSNNVTSFIEHYWDADASTLNLDLNDEILNNCLLTHKGEVRKRKEL